MEPVLNHRRFLLCACDSIPKAFAVTAYAHSGAVTAEELHALLHRDLIPLPSQPVAELGAHADPFSMAVIHRCAPRAARSGALIAGVCAARSFANGHAHAIAQTPARRPRALAPLPDFSPS